jgi:hypothetical protein
MSRLQRIRGARSTRGSATRRARRSAVTSTGKARSKPVTTLTVHILENDRQDEAKSIASLVTPPTVLRFIEGFLASQFDLVPLSQKMSQKVAGAAVRESGSGAIPK